MRRPLQVVRRRIVASLHAAGFDDLTLAHLAVFQYPGPEGARPIELAQRADMSKQAMNHLLGELEARGYLERRAVARGTEIALTHRGRAALATIRTAVISIESEWRELLGDTKYNRLHETLIELDAALRGADEE
jgi:DNA-binding MarR family transcriptional regulator